MNDMQMIFVKDSVYFDFITKEKRRDSFNPKKRIERRVIELNGKKYECEFYVYDSQYCEGI